MKEKEEKEINLLGHGGLVLEGLLNGVVDLGRHVDEVGAVLGEEAVVDAVGVVEELLGVQGDGAVVLAAEGVALGPEEQVLRGELLRGMNRERGR